MNSGPGAQSCPNQRGFVRVVIFARGVISPPQRPAIYLRDRQGGRNFRQRQKGVGAGRGGRSCTPDGLGYALVPACDRPQRSTRAERRLLNELTLMRHAATAAVCGCCVLVHWKFKAPERFKCKAWQRSWGYCRVMHIPPAGFAVRMFSSTTRPHMNPDETLPR